jgi:hypothetical protein
MIRMGPEPVPGNRQRGGGRLKALVWTLILAAMAFVLYKEVPPRINDYELQDKMREEALFASASRKTPEDVRNAIFEKIQDLGIPAKKEDIKVEVNLRGCRISVEYTVPIDLMVYQHELHFHPAADNRSL